MKKVLLIMLILMIVVVMVVYVKKGDNENLNIVDDVNYLQKDVNYHQEDVNDGQNGKDPLDDLRGKTSFNIDDLDRIDEYNFPKSYMYVTYNRDGGKSTVETGSYVYLSGVDHKLLLPIHESMVSRDVVSSEVENNRITTLVDIMLENGEGYSIKYVVDSDTLNYVGASLDAPTSVTYYTFEY